MAKRKAKFVFNEQILNRDIQHYANLFCEAVANEAKYYIWEFAQYQIGEYYNEYDPPFYYHRTNQEKTYSFQIFSERSPKGYRGGIVFDNSIIHHEKAGVSEDYIEKMVWRSGYHGYYKNGKNGEWLPITGEPNRFGIIQKYAEGQTIDGFTFPREKIIAKAKGVAQKGQYSMLNFS